MGGQNLSRWPSHNAAWEDQVLTDLQGPDSKSHHEACRWVREQEALHAVGRRWIWAQLLDPLGLLIQRAHQPMVGNTPEEFIASSTTDGWEVDLSAWKALAMAHSPGRRGAQGVAALLRP